MQAASERAAAAGGPAVLLKDYPAHREVKHTLNMLAVVDIFQAHIDLGADNTAYPESAAGWQLYAQVQSSGNFVCMIVLSEGYVIPENVFDL